jgi:hypothetical protein
MLKLVFIAIVGMMIFASCKDPKTIEERPFGSSEQSDTTGMLTYDAFYLENSTDSCPMKSLSIYPVDSTFRISWRSAQDSITTGHIVQDNAKDTDVWKLVCDSDNNIYLLTRGMSDSSELIFTGFNDSMYIKRPLVLKQQEKLQ